MHCCWFSPHSLNLETVYWYRACSVALLFACWVTRRVVFALHMVRKNGFQSCCVQIRLCIPCTKQCMCSDCIFASKVQHLADEEPAISLAIQLRLQCLKHVHVALDMQIMMMASKLDSSQAKGGDRRIERRTSATQRPNHTTRPVAQ